MKLFLSLSLFFVSVLTASEKPTGAIQLIGQEGTTNLINENKPKTHYWGLRMVF